MLCLDKKNMIWIAIGHCWLVLIYLFYGFTYIFIDFWDNWLPDMQSGAHLLEDTFSCNTHHQNSCHL